MGVGGSNARTISLDVLCRAKKDAGVYGYGTRVVLMVVIIIGHLIILGGWK